jgi:hypothetical protein
VSSGWDAQTPKRLQRELCKLRLINKKFLEPATRYLLSHGTLAFDVSYLDSSSISAQTRYCLSPENQDIVARIPGLRIDLLLSAFSRHLQLFRLDLQQPGSRVITASRIAAAETARDEFLRALPSFGNRFNSVRALEIRFQGGGRPESNIEPFIRKTLPKLKSLDLRCDTEGM